MSSSSSLKTSESLPPAKSDVVLGTPSRVCGLSNRDICIVDSQNHSLWVLNRNGKVKYRIGTGAKGHKDGHLRDAEFNAPESAAVFHNCLFVTDSGNNLIREVNLTNASVTTISHPLSSPIDIYEFHEKLFILSSKSRSIYTFDPIRKIMEEAIQGNFKQPSGLTTNGELLFFTDLSTNSIKAWDGKNVLNLYTAPTPQDLNKPMSLSYSGNNLYIADTYNHQIKVLSLNSKTLVRLIGSGKSGNVSSDFSKTELNFPTSVFISGMSLFICDRGNNEVKVAELLLSKVQPYKVHR